MHRNGGAIRTTLLVALTVFMLSGSPSISASTRRGPPQPLPPGLSSQLQARPRYVVMLVLDGALPSYFKLAQFPHLAALIRRGTRYTRAWDGMLESETPTGHATLGTGSLPRRHGVISFGWVTDGNVQQQPTNPIPIEQGQLENLLKRSGVPSIASLLKQHDPHARVVVTSGHKDYAVDSVGGWAADYLMYYAVRNQIWTPLSIPRHVPPRSVLTAPGLTTFAPHLYPGEQDSLAVKLALTAFQQIKQTVTIINLPEFDWPLGHLNGGGEDRWLAWKLMNQLDADLATIESVYAQAHVLNKTLFVLTADHGMLTLKHLIPHDEIQNAVKSAGASLSDYQFHTAAYLWIRETAKIRAVAAKLVALHDPRILAVYYRDPGSVQYTLEPGAGRLPAQLDRAYRFLLSTFAGHTSPHVVAFLTENSGVSGRNQVGWRGDHGGPSWNAEHIPLVLAGPGVRQGDVSTYPATLYDVAPTVLRLLGASTTGMDGVALEDALTDPDLSLVQAQTNQGREDTAYQQALMAESRRDG